MPNDFYNHGTYPIAGSAGSSALLRSELDAIAAGFDKLAPLTGNAGKLLLINSSGTAQTVSLLFSESGTTATIAATNVTWSGNPTHSNNHTFSGNVTLLGTTTISGPLTLSGSALSSPPPIGNVAPNTGAFTSVSSTTGYVFPDATVQTTAAGSGAFTGYQALATLSYLGY